MQVSEPEVNGRIAAMAAQSGTSPSQMRQDLERAGRVNELALAIREQKVLDRILEKAKFTEVTAEAWNASEDARAKSEKAAKAGSKKKA